MSLPYGEKIVRVFSTLVYARRPFCTSEFMKMLDCSKQSVGRVIRDIQAMYGMQLEVTQRGKEYCYELKPDRRPKSAQLSEEEMDLLWMMRGLTQRLLGDAQFEEATQALDKAQVLLDGKQSEAFPHFASMSQGTIDYTPHQETIRTLIDAMNKKRVCRITYKAADAKRAKTYHIRPLKIFSFEGTLYLHAQKAMEPGAKYVAPEFDPILAIQRFRKVQIADGKAPFTVPETYDFEKAFNREFGIMKDKPFTVEAEFTGWAAKYVAERIWSPDQKIAWDKDGDGLRIRFTATSKDEVVSWILSFGHCARLLGPTELVKDLQDQLVRMAEQY